MLKRLLAKLAFENHFEDAYDIERSMSAFKMLEGQCLCKYNE